MKTSIKILGPLLCAALWAFTGCKQKDATLSTPTMGEVVIGCDVQLRHLMQQQEEIFEQRYKYAKVHLKFLTERDLLQQWLSDSFRTVIMGRELSPEETQYFQQQRQVSPRQFPFAQGAIALLTHPSNPDSSLTYEELLALCRGAQPGPEGFSGVVLEDAASGISHYVLKLLGQSSFSGPVYALADKAEIFEYLKKNPGALALVDWAEFSDSDDLQRQRQLRELTRVGITRPADSTQYGYLFPDQYSLQDSRYPLQRTWQFASSSGRSDLGLGFASFVTGEIGQRIILKAGLLPLFQTERWIEFVPGDFRVVQ
ncbi:MAG: substrate-binding domain-containing protein [Saprospiraceae bacterium]|nr:substrate-binding domain-containing protein [Saprospiraceae bacterium]